ncbi:hypothetical protein KAJ89_04180 [Candidatus Parcubacteria bacterium]|nr:hypothetical protein [Candidatus Parcubacteria bacterium]
MKKVILIFSLLLFVVCPVSASELIGQISTNPSELPGQDEDPGLLDDPIPPSNNPGTSGGSPSQGAGLIIDKRQKQDDPYQEEIKVLGISYEPYQDSTLLRGSDKKIYIIEGQIKKHIASLDELKKYAGQIIYDVTDAELAKYQERKHLNNDLIREQGREEIYIIENDKKRHIISIEELRARYFGQEIFNVSSLEMRLYSTSP